MPRYEQKQTRSQIRRRSHLKRTYGITPEEYDMMLQEQGGVCAICGDDRVPAHYTGLVPDHDHSTGKVRGLLCNQCNLMLGHARDDISILAKGIEYLNEEGE